MTRGKSFKEVAPALAKKLASVVLEDMQTFEIDNLTFKVEFLKDSDMREINILKWMYHKMLYLRHGVSGNARFFRLVGPFTESSRRKWRVYGCSLTTNYGPPVRMEEVESVGNDIMYVAWVGSPPAYTYSCHLVALFCFSRFVEELFELYFKLDDEEEVKTIILAVARIAKSLAKMATPVVVDGEIVDVAPVNYEDIIFNQLLVHELARLRMRGLDRNAT